MSLAWMKAGEQLRKLKHEAAAQPRTALSDLVLPLPQQPVQESSENKGMRETPAFIHITNRNRKQFYFRNQSMDTVELTPDPVLKNHPWQGSVLKSR